MIPQPTTPRPRPRIPKTFFALFGIWTLIVVGALGANLYFSLREDREDALSRAADSYQRDLALLRWSAEHGGIYVPLDAKATPDPRLTDRPDREATTTQGKVLTLVNPTHLTRMIHELGSGDEESRGHLTSLNPLRPENAPDPWERKALEILGRGSRDYSEVLRDGRKSVLRFMGVLHVEPSCLTCHAEQGYRVGEVRGGISVTVPVRSTTGPTGMTHEDISILAVLGFWAMGGAGLFVWVRRLKQSARERAQMLENLEDSARRFRLLFESSPAPMAIHQAGHITHANPAIARLLDAPTPEGLLGQEILRFVHPDYRELAMARVRAARETAQPAPPIEELFVTLADREVWVEVQTAPLQLPGGPAILVFAQDLTERRRAEEERRKLEAEVQHAQKLESLGSLAGGISHDMNNVLSAILGMASLLQTKHEGDAALVGPLQTIENAATRGRDLVKGLTDFARKGLQTEKALDLNALVRKELELLIRTSRQRFAFEVHLEEGLPPILGEESTLGSAFMNVCVNAFDAMPRGGTLTVQTRLEGDQVSLVVADTGEGIPADILHRVTDPFFTTKPPGRGTGLGLAMVYGTVKAHEGSLDIQSEVGKGTRVCMRFPSLEPGASTEGVGPQVSQSVDHPLRILVVDDDELVRGILPPMLEQLGHQVETASSGLGALRRLEAGMEVDLVILDHNMPGLSGADTLPRIFQYRPGVRAIISTGFLDTELKLLLADFPSVLTLQKPYSLAELRRVVQPA